MSFMQKLCDVYDAVIDTSGAEGEASLLPMGFTQKKIEFNIILSPSGELVTAQRLNEQAFAVPSTPQAESRSSDITPFPLADSLKYLMGKEKNGNLDSYLAQLDTWCAEPHAPQCLRVLLAYLQKKTLYVDLSAVVWLKLEYDKGDTPGKGKDADKTACFSVECPGEENRLWMREDVKQSWRMHFAASLGNETALCYVTGKQLPPIKKHPYLQVTSRLISSKDEAFPFQYKGRFTEDGSAATISVEASTKMHRALRWLLEHQSFRRYGISFVGWNTIAPILKPALIDEEEEAGKAVPDTLQGYIEALFDSVQGNSARFERAIDPDNTSEEVRKRQEEIVLLGLQSATKGRVSVNYVQEMPGNVFVQHVQRWNEGCRWQMMQSKALPAERPATWHEICEAVMGADTLQLAKRDFKAEKAANKYMREVQLRLLHCVVEAQPIPEQMVSAAFNRAVQPLSFTDSKGHWSNWQWQSCVSTACAMIRKHYLDQMPARILSPVLDTACTDRDYLYGRLLALAHRIEQAAVQRTSRKIEQNIKTNAVRMMRYFVQQPRMAWMQLYAHLLPYLRALGKDGYSAQYYKHLLGQVESLFAPVDIDSGKPLSYLFLVGFSAQTRDLWLAAELRQKQAPMSPYVPPKTRDALFGCLLAVADYCEWMAEKQQADHDKTISFRDGRTNAMRLSAMFIARPMTTWAKIHDKTIPYLEKLGVKAADTIQRLLRKTEQCFVQEERLSDAALGRGFLHGYLTMLEALQHRGGLDADAWKPVCTPLPALPPCREAAYGALLALENRTERRILDLDKTAEENRPSNAMRFMVRAAQRPDEVWAYLQDRMRPYANKYWFPQPILRQAKALQAWIEENYWNHDQPLGAEYLYYFYIYNQTDKRKDD